MAEEQQDNSSFMESDLDVAAKKWENELTLESGEELPTDEDNQLTHLNRKRKNLKKVQRRKKPMRSMRLERKRNRKKNYMK